MLKLSSQIKLLTKSFLTMLQHLGFYTPIAKVKSENPIPSLKHRDFICIRKKKLETISPRYHTVLASQSQPDREPYWQKTYDVMMTLTISTPAPSRRTCQKRDLPQFHAKWQLRDLRSSFHHGDTLRKWSCRSLRDTVAACGQ